MKKVKVLFCLGLMLYGERSLSSGHGIDRIKDIPHYHAIRFRGSSSPLSVFGYALKDGTHLYGWGGNTLQSWKQLNDIELTSGWRTNPEVVVSSFTDDIKNAILDRDRFGSKLINKEFFEAWSMGRGGNEQGLRWKERAFSETKKYLKKLVRKSILEKNDEKMVKAEALARLFPDVVPAAAGAGGWLLPSFLGRRVTAPSPSPRSQLLTFIEKQKIKAEDFLAGL